MSAYDRWLEAPYVDAARQEDAFEKWCEAKGVAFDAPDAWERFEADEAASYEEWCDDQAEQRAEARLERD